MTLKGNDDLSAPRAAECVSPSQIEHDEACQGHSVAMLASVRNGEEAALCVSAGVDLIDAKEPRAGALGAVLPDTLRDIRRAVPNSIALSATIGDDIVDAGEIALAGQAMADAGADIVKIGLFEAVDVEAMLQALQPDLSLRRKFVAVLLADQALDLTVLSKLSKAGFYGVMLDTVEKASGGLTTCQSPSQLRQFIDQARGLGLKAGLAGGLTLQDLPLVLACKPDIVGFRGALAECKDRSAHIDRTSLQRVRASIPMVVYN
ncbi:MAG: (5-formylfuran-3-yl)methyl phosphate synthase [Hyphomicrobiaceae bacterium]